MQPNTFFKQKERLMRILKSCNWTKYSGPMKKWHECCWFQSDGGLDVYKKGSLKGMLMWEGRIAALEFQALVGGSENKKKYLLEKKRGGNFFPLRAISSFCWFPSSYDLYVVLSGPVLYLQPASEESQNFSWWQESMVHFIKLRCAVLRSIVEWKNRKKVMPGMHTPESAPHREILGAWVYWSEDVALRKLGLTFWSTE